MKVHTPKETKTRFQSILSLDVIIVIKRWWCTFVTTKYNPTKANTKVSNAKNRKTLESNNIYSSSFDAGIFPENNTAILIGISPNKAARTIKSEPAMYFKKFNNFDPKLVSFWNAWLINIVDILHLYFNLTKIQNDYHLP